MSIAPQQNWILYEEKCRDARAESLRALTPLEGFKLFEDMHQMASRQNDGSPGLERLSRARRKEKLMIRRAMVQVFRKLDLLRREAEDSNNAV